MKFQIRHDFGNGRLAKVTLRDFGVGTQTMFHLGLVALDSMKGRIGKAIGSDDVPMKPLSQKYGAIKNKRTGRVVKGIVPYAVEKARLGLVPIRNLTGPGDRFRQLTIQGPNGKETKWQRKAKDAGSHMLDALRVTYADETTVKIGITTREGRMKALANEQKAPWFGLSGNDAKAVYTAAEKIFHGGVASIRAKLRAA